MTLRKFLKQLLCWHLPDEVHGYDNLPLKGSHCLKGCGKEF